MESAQAHVDAIVDDLLPRTALRRRSAIHVEVRADPQPDAFSQVWRTPGWEADFCEARQGEEWDHDPQARLVITTGLIAALTTRRLRAVIAHELAHIEAGDHLAQTWLANGPSRRREQRADLRAIDICGDGTALAAGILHIFRRVAPETPEHRRTHGSAVSRASAIRARMGRDLEL